MIKERHFKVHPNVLSCLLHLRLRTELGVRASDTHASKPETKKPPLNGKGKKSEQVHLSKKAKKVFREQKEIDKELREAGAEVDKEERRTTVSTIYTSFLKASVETHCKIANRNPETPILSLFPHSKKS